MASPHLLRNQRVDKCQVSEMQKPTCQRGRMGNICRQCAQEGASWSASSSSCDGEDHKLAYKGHGRNHQSCVRRPQSSKLKVRCQQCSFRIQVRGEDAMPDEDCKMEVSPEGAASIQPSWNRLSQCGQSRPKQQFKILQDELNRVFDVQPQPVPATPLHRVRRTVETRGITRGRSRR